MVRAPGGQLITRVKTEAAAGKLAADVVNHSDRGLMLAIEDLFMDYAPPNGADYLHDARVSPKLWPHVDLGLVDRLQLRDREESAEDWMDLTKPEYNKQIGQIFAPSGGTTWTRTMFERQVLGEDYWTKQAATEVVLFPSGAPPPMRWCGAKSRLCRRSTTSCSPKQRDGAPIDIFFAPEGMPATPYATGVPKTAANPNAAKLFLNWCLSDEGQTFMIKEQGVLTSLRMPRSIARVRPQGLRCGCRTSSSSRSCARAGSRSGTRLTVIGSSRTHFASLIRATV